MYIIYTRTSAPDGSPLVATIHGGEHRHEMTGHLPTYACEEEDFSGNTESYLQSWPADTENLLGGVGEGALCTQPSIYPAP